MEENYEINELEQVAAMQLDGAAQQALKNTGKWAMFFAVLGFIGVGIIVLVGIVAGGAMMLAGSTFANEPSTGFTSGVFGGGMMIMYIIIGSIYLFPLIKLFKFSQTIEVALKKQDDSMLSVALVNLNKHYKIMGYYTIVIFGIYVLIFLGAIVFGGMASMI
jgi:hypothetical protein